MRNENRLICCREGPRGAARGKCGKANFSLKCTHYNHSLWHWTENKALTAWASAHRGKWGQLTPPGKMDEKLESENMQKRAVFYVYVYFESNHGRQV